MPGLIGTGFELQGQGLQGLGDVGAIQVQRRGDNKRAAAEASAARGQMIGTIAGALTGAALPSLEEKKKEAVNHMSKTNGDIGGGVAGETFKGAGLDTSSLAPANSNWWDFLTNF